MTHDWAELVPSAQPSIVLPPGDRRAQVSVPGPLCLERVLDLGSGHAVAVVRSADDARWCVPIIVDDGVVRRSAPGDGTAERLVRLLQDPGQPTAAGFTVRPHTRVPLAPDAVLGERGISADQTNQSVIVDEHIVVKWMTGLPPADQPGSPAASRIGALAAADFVEMPTPYGFLSASGPNEAEQVLAVAVAYLPGAEDGWNWATADLRAWLAGASDFAAAVAAATRLGAMTARMHAGLARLGVDPASADQARAWQQQATADLAEAVTVVRGPFADRLRTWQPRIASALTGLGSLAGTATIAIHGDLHVGQVLRAVDPGGTQQLLVTDFDGNPTLPMSQRWAAQPAAVDVVGMLASLDHVGRIVQYRDPGSDLERIRRWIAVSQQQFLAAYRSQATDLGTADLLDERLLAPWRLWQELREIRYAVAHLPHWVYVPELALADLLDDHPLPQED